MDKIKLTEKMWDDFLETAVDASGASGWKWFEKEYGLTDEAFKQLLLDNAGIVDRLAQLFRKMYVETDCSTTFKLHDVNMMIRECFAFEGDNLSTGEKILDLTKQSEPDNVCPNCKKSYPEILFPPMDGDNLCNDCFSKQEEGEAI